MARNRKKQLKLTSTTRHLLAKVPDSVLVLPPPVPGEIPVGRQPIPRLGMRAGLPARCTPESLANQILLSPKDAMFFCDANMFIGQTNEVIWDALLLRQIAIVPPILDELSSWSRDPKYNLRVHSAFTKMLARDSSTAFNVYQFDSKDPVARGFLEYYMNLLCLRKQLWGIVSDQLMNQLGSQPTPSEIEACIKRQLGERAFQRARKGLQAEGSPTFHADEQLVVTAFAHAIAFGTEAIILTRDPDVQEQLYKLFWLVDTHYRAMLFADAYANDPGSFVSQRMPKGHPKVREAFVGDDDVLVEGTPGLLDALLPEKYRPIVVYCLLVAGPDDNLHFCLDSYCAEREMMRLMKTKSLTGGLNTDRLTRKNCHIWLSPLPLPGGHAAIVSDRRCDLGELSIPLLDIQHAIATNEGIRHVQVDET